MTIYSTPQNGINESVTASYSSGVNKKQLLHAALNKKSNSSQAIFANYQPSSIKIDNKSLFSVAQLNSSSTGKTPAASQGGSSNNSIFGFSHMKKDGLVGEMNDVLGGNKTMAGRMMNGLNDLGRTVVGDKGLGGIPVVGGLFKGISNVLFGDGKTSSNDKVDSKSTKTTTDTQSKTPDSTTTDNKTTGDKPSTDGTTEKAKPNLFEAKADDKDVIKKDAGIEEA